MLLEQKNLRSKNREEKVKVILQNQPQLEKGINLVSKQEKLPVFQKLVSAELRTENKKAVWIDSKNEASTYALSGNNRTMDKIKIGRAFTPFQHHSLVHQLEQFIDEKTEILVLPNIDYLYTNGQIKKWESEELFQETWKEVQKLQEKHNLIVLTSVTEQDFDQRYLMATDNKIKVVSTQEGWKYNSKNYKQHFYRSNSGLQTTLAFWRNKNTKENTLLAEVA